MVKLMMLFRRPEDEERFEKGYVQTLAKLERMSGIVRQQANMVYGSPEGQSKYYRILELYFASYEALDNAMRSPEGMEAGQSLLAYAGDLVEILFVDVLEENYSEAS